VTVSKRFPTPEEDAELDAQGRELLEAVRQQRERERRMRQWLREQVEAGAKAKADEERGSEP
jgi:hypothetical protein